MAFSTNSTKGVAVKMSILLLLINGLGGFVYGQGTPTTPAPCNHKDCPESSLAGLGGSKLAGGEPQEPDDGPDPCDHKNCTDRKPTTKSAANHKKAVKSGLGEEQSVTTAGRVASGADPAKVMDVSAYANEDGDTHRRRRGSRRRYPAWRQPDDNLVLVGDTGRTFMNCVDKKYNRSTGTLDMANGDDWTDGDIYGWSANHAGVFMQNALCGDSGCSCLDYAVGNWCGGEGGNYLLKWVLGQYGAKSDTTTRGWTGDTATVACCACGGGEVATLTTTADEHIVLDHLTTVGGTAWTDSNGNECAALLQDCNQGACRKDGWNTAPCGDGAMGHNANTACAGCSNGGVVTIAPNLCSVPTVSASDNYDLTGCNTDSAQISVAECNVGCAAGYTGTITASCTTHGGAFALSGTCQADGCSSSGIENSMTCGDGTTCKVPPTFHPDNTTHYWGCCEDHGGRSKCPVGRLICTNIVKGWCGDDYCCLPDPNLDQKAPPTYSPCAGRKLGGPRCSTWTDQRTPAPTATPPPTPAATYLQTMGGNPFGNDDRLSSLASTGKASTRTASITAGENPTPSPVDLDPHRTASITASEHPTPSPIDLDPHRTASITAGAGAVLDRKTATIVRHHVRAAPPDPEQDETDEDEEEEYQHKHPATITVRRQSPTKGGGGAKPRKAAKKIVRAGVRTDGSAAPVDEE